MTQPDQRSDAVPVDVEIPPPPVVSERKIFYFSGNYKYQLERDHAAATHILIPEYVETPFVRMWPDGRMLFIAGYAWDGPSNPAIDSRNFMRGSLYHDGLYQLMRMSLIDPARYRKPADLLLVDVCREDGMSAARRAWVYAGVRLGGRRGSSPKRVRKFISAP